MSNHPEPSITNQYLADLRRELFIRGLTETQIQAVVTETQSHLTEMFEAIKPETAEAYGVLMSGFGSANTLAKKIAKEYDGSALPRKFWWPALATFVFTELFSLLGLYGNTSAVVAVTALLLGVVSLLVLGFLARKPILGQFFTLFALMLVGGTVYAGFTGYPIGQITDPGVPCPPQSIIPQQAVPHFVSDTQKFIAQRQSLINEIKVGRDYFTSGKPANAAPAFVRQNGKYLMPDGVENSSVANLRADRYGPSIALAFSWSFQDAKQVWNDGSTALNVIERLTKEMNHSKNTLAYVDWIKTQPLSTQLRLDFLALVYWNLFYCIDALIVTNLGWLAWLLCRVLGRTWRRLIYAQRKVTYV